MGFKPGKISLLRNIATVSNNLFLSLIVTNYKQVQVLTLNIKDAERLDAAVQTAHKTSLPTVWARVPATVLSMRSDSTERPASVSLNQQCRYIFVFCKSSKCYCWLFFECRINVWDLSEEAELCFVFTIWSRAKHKKQVQKAQWWTLSRRGVLMSLLFSGHFLKSLHFELNQNSDESMLDNSIWTVSAQVFLHIRLMFPSHRLNVSIS